MRHRAPFLTTLAIVTVASFIRPAARGDDSQPTVANVDSSVEEPSGFLAKGMELERQRSWSAAIEVYEDLLKRWPDQSGARQRLRLCESHYKLNRRYTDRSFRDVLLRLPDVKAFELYDELLGRIESHYVERVAFEPLLRHGLDNLEVALRDPAFLRINAPSARPEQVKALRATLRSRRGQLASPGRAEALVVLRWACNEAGRGAGIPPSAVVLEFTYGACDALDDYTTYLTPDKLDDLFGLIDGNFVGLGVELKQDEAGLRLVNVLSGGPAWDAGLRIGDRITEVDSAPLRGLSLDEAAGKLQGEDGSTVNLVVLLRSGDSKPFRLTRRPVEVKSVAQVRVVDPVGGVGYVQLSGFQKNSTEELRQAIADLQTKGMRYLVLDLRGNPGGLLNVAVDIADLFLDSGVIVSTRGRAANQTAVYPAHRGALWRMPVAVLVDHDSASASEILAGALKENRRAIVIGERSYGKGSVQSIYPLRVAPAGLKMTTAKFYSPLNHPYSENGIEPDLAVTARIAARPSGDGKPAPEIEFGVPEHDPVLSRAIAQARRSSANR